MKLGFTLDGNDLWTTYGIQVQRTKGLLDLLNRKEPYEFDWPDSSGVEPFVNSSDITFESREIVLHCYLKATSRNTFFQQYNSFKKFIQSPKTFMFEVPFLGYEHEVFYIGGSSMDWVSYPSGKSPGYDPTIVSQFWFVLKEVSPVEEYY